MHGYVYGLPVALVRVRYGALVVVLLGWHACVVRGGVLSVNERLVTATLRLAPQRRKDAHIPSLPLCLRFA